MRVGLPVPLFSGTHESRTAKNGALNSDPLCRKNGAVLSLQEIAGENENSALVQAFQPDPPSQLREQRLGLKRLRSAHLPSASSPQFARSFDSLQRGGGLFVKVADLHDRRAGGAAVEIAGADAVAAELDQRTGAAFAHPLGGGLEILHQKRHVVESRTVPLEEVVVWTGSFHRLNYLNLLLAPRAQAAHRSAQ